MNYYRVAIYVCMYVHHVNLCSWSSNSTELKAIATQDNTADDNNALCLCWNPTTDELAVAGKPKVLQDLHIKVI